jgi:hypothetical protein
MRAALRESAKFVVEETDADALVAGATNALASEQETRLMQGEVGGMTSPLAARARGTEAVGPQNAATLVGTQAAGNETAGVVGNETVGVVGSETAGVAKDATRISPNAKRDDKSVVTRVRIIDNPPAPRRSSRRTLGLAAGVLVVALVTAAVYSLTNNDAPVSPASQPTPQANEQPASTSPQPTAEAGQPAATPSPTREATPAKSRPAPAPTVRNEKPQEQTPPVVEVKPPTPPAPVGHPDADAQAEAEADAIFRNRDWVNNPPTDEEMRRWTEQFPRRARMIQQRIQRQNEQRRRSNRRLPAPRPPDQRPPP